MKTHLNLLPTSVLRGQVIRKSLSKWASVASIAILAALGLGIYQGHHVDKLELRQNDLETSYVSTQQTIHNVKRLRREIEQIESRQAVAISFVDEKSIVTALGQIATAAHSAAGFVAVERLTFHAGDAASDVPANHIELRGVASDNVALAEFVAALRASNLFAEVDLKSSGATQVRSQPARNYLLHCSY